MSHKNNMENGEADVKVAEPDIVVAVDFGTRGTGFSWCFAANPAAVFNHMHWPEEADPMRKTSTSILFEGNTPVAFGKKAELKWKNLCNEEASEGFYLFKQFKMQLSEMSSTGEYVINQRRARCTSVCGSKQMDAVEVIAGSLKLIKEHVMSLLQKDAVLRDKIDYQIRWVLTVPAIWNERSKIIMKEAARKAGIHDLGIALEPEAASLCVRQQMTAEAISPGRVIYWLMLEEVLWTSWLIKSTERGKLKNLHRPQEDLGDQLQSIQISWNFCTICFLKLS